MSMHFPFDNSYARLGADFSAVQAPVKVSAPALIAVNRPLADELGITLGGDADMAGVFAGNVLPDGAEPIAQAYAGHQFGGFSPQLGDGRAVLLGEVVDSAGLRRDIQLKGSGPTPFSRNGDGRAWLGPVLREYVVSEAMHAMGIPTTRALAAAVTGDAVHRQQGALPGAVLTRVAASHLRVGTFQFFAARRDADALRQLFDYTCARHYPGAQTPGDLLREVIGRQARLVAQWLGVGFIHGVMNTDNTALSGETIDYGPCAFLDVWHPQTVFSSIDRQGRYAYDNQARIIVWNMAQFASALVPLAEDEDRAIAEFTEAVHAMPAMIDAEWLRVFGAKIGLADAREEDRALIDDLLQLMQQSEADFTNTFRALPRPQARAAFADTAAFDAWEARWQARLESEPDWRAHMDAANPAFIPRNHRVEQMIEAAVDGDLAPFHRLMAVLSRPFEDQPDAQDLALPPQPQEVVRETFCGT
ncbi:YdiU family protein [Pelagivirga sediminicola]|uniref:Protein nucleotidyltransferase YdiU n=1 Tax=Pelagivirga sediminicola TaxID=2170575 RepID=A0A2T7G494_9RHOB|nr:YdiU family protein [Pelagivirga sediminicola]PVA09228.1 YdiU family protein [Pelagivirga sediminicola]